MEILEADLKETLISSLTYLSSQTLYNAVQWLIYTKPAPGKPQELEVGATDGIERMFRQRFTWEKLKTIIGDRHSNEVVLAKFK